MVPGAILRRDKGGGQSQLQVGQEVLESPNLILFLNLQYKAGPHTPNAETTANTTKQHLKQVADRLDISFSLSLLMCFSFVSVSLYLEKARSNLESMTASFVKAKL